MAGVSQTNRSNTAAADGTTTVFNFTFFAYSTDTVKVYSVLNDVLTPITTGITKVLNSNFIGGTVTFDTAPASAVGDILIRREVPYTQETELADLTRYKETALETALNSIVLQVQQLVEDVGLAAKYTTSSGVTDPTIEEPSDGDVLIYDGILGRIKPASLASLSSSLDTIISGAANNDFLVHNGTAWRNLTASASRTAMGVAIGTDVQAYDAGLQSIAGLTTAANKMIYTTASDTYATADLTAAARALLADGNAASQRATLDVYSTSEVDALIPAVPMTNWASWTATLQGFGTSPTQSCLWRRVGDSIEVMGVITAGTSPAASEAQINLPNSYTIDSTKVPSTRLAGTWCYGAASAGNGTVLAKTGAVGYFNLGLQNALLAGITPQNGNAIMSTGTVISFRATLPITQLAI